LDLTRPFMDDAAYLFYRELIEEQLHYERLRLIWLGGSPRHKGTNLSIWKDRHVISRPEAHTGPA
jgi:hypothetical protein